MNRPLLSAPTGHTSCISPVSMMAFGRGLSPVPARCCRGAFRYLIAFALNAIAVTWAGAAATDTATAVDRTIFAGSIKRGMTATSAATSSAPAVDPSESMEFMIALKMRNFSELSARIAQGGLVARAEMESRYFPLETDYLKVVDWLKAQGFNITKTDPARLGVSARGTVAQVSTSLQVGFVRRDAEGKSYPSAVDAPSLPLSIASPVLSINGLQPDIQLRRHSRRLSSNGVTTQINNSPPFYPREVLKAYGGDTLTADGSGQKIGIVIDTFPLDSDLTSFWSQAGISQSLSNIEKVQVVPGTLPGPGGEETLDVEWASGIAPGAKVRVYASLDLSFVHIDQVFQQIVNDLPTQPALKQISISLGLGETFVGSGQLQTDAQYFASMAAAGVTVYVSSGDSGSNEGGQLQVSYFASDVNVTGVGGTSLFLNSSTGAVTNETVWSGSGGGISANFNRPVWQAGTGVAAGTKRLVPDVAAVGDPATGGYVVLTGAIYQFGGTSWSAPIWAGISARINQGRAASAMPPLGLLGPRIYPLIGTPSFRDITSGSNGAYSATAGFDMCTGIGVAHVANLFNALTTTSTQPNLQPAQPLGWSDVIVVSKTTGTNVDDFLTPADTINVDFGFANVGGVPTSGTFSTELYLDNVLKATFQNTSPLAVNAFSTVTDYSIGKLALGTHTLRIKIDSGNAITESSEADNEYTKTFTVAPPSLFDSYTNASVTSTGSTPHTFMGDPITLNSSGGTSNISVASGVAYLRALTSTSYTNIRLNVTFWGAASGATSGSTPAFSNFLGAYSFDLGPLNASAGGFYSYPFTLPSPVIFPSQAGGITLNWQGNTGGGLTTTDNLTSVLRYGSAAPISGSFTVGTPGIFGYYRNASNETDGNFLGSSFRSVGDVNGAFPNQGLALQLYGPPDSPPTIATHPSNVTAAVGSNATFSVVATGKPSPSYQWQRQPSGTTGFADLSEGGNYFFVTTSNLSVSASALAMNGDQFRCVVTNSLGTATSNAATLTVLSAPVITQQPLDVAVTAGQPATLTVSATGTGTLSYQWRRNGLPLVGATGANFALNPAHVADNGNYNVVVTASGIETLSSTVTLTVAPTRYPGAMYIDPTFAPMIESLGGSINAIAPQPDGKLLIAGDRMRVNGSTLRAITRLNTDGSVDSSFDPGLAPNEWIRAVALQPDGKILIGGDFTTVNGVSRGRIARLNANGSLDLGFDTSVGANDWVLSLAVDADGSIMVGGFFTQFNGVARNFLARLSSTGAVLSGFDPGVGPNSNVNHIAFQSDGKMIISGFFTSYAGASRPHVARVNTNGSLDTSFNPVGALSASDEVDALALQAGGKILIGGYNSTANYLLRRLNTDGSLDGTFNIGSGPNSAVDSLLVQSDGKIVVGGGFSIFNGLSRSRIARLNADGSLDSFVTATSDMYGWINALAVLPDGKLAIGGRFFDSISGGNITAVRRFTTAGARDSGFAAETRTSGSIYEMIQQPDGKLLLAGYFTHVNGVARNHTARLLANGALDTSFNPGTGFDSGVETMVLQSDGKIVYGGFFYSFNGTSRLRLARANVDGSLDSSFNPGMGPDYGVTALARQADGKLLIGGAFTSYAGTTRNHIARIKADGSFDATFNPGTGTNEWPLYDLTLQPDGRVLFAGWFNSYNGASRNGLARIMPDGALDTSFAPASANTGFSLLLQPDGKVVYSGGLTIARFLANGSTDSTFVAPSTFARESRSTLFRQTADPAQAPARRDFGRNAGFVTNRIQPQTTGGLDIGVVGSMFRQPDGKILVGQEINSSAIPTPVGIARLMANGAFDSSFSAGGILDAKISRFIMLDDGQLLLAGGMFNDGVVQQGGLVRLTYQVTPTITTQPVAQSVTLGGDATFTVAGAGGGLRYQWFFDATPITGATGAKLTLPKVTTANAGPYSVTVSNGVSSVTSNAVALTVIVPPAIVIQPVSRSVGVGGLHTFSVAASGTAPLTYKWRKNGNEIVGATNSELPFAAVSVSDAGPYDVVVTNTGGFVTSNVAVLTVLPNPGAFSSRQFISAAGATSYFALEGNQTKHLLLRAVGPTLASFGVTGVLADPQMSVLDANGTVVASNDDWGTVTGVDLSAIFAQVGAFPLPNGSHDSALYATLPPGSYQVKISGVGGTTGQALLELYDTDTNSTTRIAYLGLRGQMDSANGGLTGALAIRNSANKRLLIRAIGPTLGGANALPDPQLQIYDGPTVIASNDNWSNAPTLITAATQAGAFSLPTSSLDAALLIDQRIGSGSYYATVPYSGASADALVEIYDLNAAGVPAYAPLVVVPPVSTTTTVGNSVTLRAFAVGGGTLSYQWRKNGNNIVGATSSTFTLASPVSSDAGNYDVTVNSSFGNATSGVAALGINKANQTITFGALANKTFGDAPFAVSASATSNLAVSFSVASGPATISGNTVTITGAGNVTIRASQPGNADYNAAPVVDQSFTVATANQTISFALAKSTYALDESPVTLTGTASSGLAVSYSSSDPTVATVSGSSLTLLKVGTTTITATQSGNANYNAATPVAVNLQVTSQSQTITFAATELPAKTFGNADFAIHATSNRGLLVGFTSNNPAVATVGTSTLASGISSATVTIVGAGTANITASQPGDSNTAAATDVVRTLTVSKAAATIALGGLSQTYDGTPKPVTVTTNPAALNVALTYTPTGGSPTSTAPTNAGSYAVNAAISGSTPPESNYTGTASGTLVIAKANQTISFTLASPVLINASPITLTGTATSTLAVAYASSNTAVATVSGSTLTVKGLGTTTITASQAGDGNFNAAADVARTLTVNPVAPVIASTPPLTQTAAVGSAFLFGPITVNALAAPYTFSATGLPAGLTVNSASGNISGTPTASPGSFTIVLTVSNATGNDSRTINLTLQPPAPVFTSAASASGTVGTAFSYTAAASNATSYTLSGTLPAGLTFASGVISGTPTTAGTTTVNITATNTTGSVTLPLVITLVLPANAPVYTGTTTPSGVAGTAFSFTPNFGTGTTTYALSGTIPSGLIINSGTGVLSWPTPQVGIYPVTVSATRSGITVPVVLTITINPAPTAPVVGFPAPGNARTATVGTAISSIQLTATPAATSFALVGTLPPGLTMTAAGLISGTPTTPGTYDTGIFASASGLTGPTAILNFTVNPHPNAPVITSAPVAAGRVGVALSYTLTSTPSGTTTYGMTGTLPTGLTFNGTAGTVAGTPAAGTTGSYVVFFAGTNASGTGAALDVVFNVAPPLTVPVVNSNGTASAQVGQLFNYVITATNSPTSFAAASLPAGLSVNASTGVISGVPSAATPTGTPASVSLTATNADGTSAPKVLLLTISPAPATPVITSAATAVGSVGTAFTYNITASDSPTSYVATGLPAGLTVNSTTGAVTGTPTVSGSFAATLRAANAAGLGAESPLTISIAPPLTAPAITSAGTATGQVGIAFSYQIVATPGTITNYALTGTLPVGLSFNSATGAIAGSPTTPGSTTVTLTATGDGGTSMPQPLAITISPAAGVPIITSSGTATGSVGSSFTYTITATNSPHTSLDAVNLPPGLAANPFTGIIQGVPTTVGTTTASLIGTNAAGTGPARDLAITVQPAAAAPVITSGSAAAAQVGTGFSYQIVATNSPTGFEVAGAPVWMTINSATGALAGTPTSPGTLTLQLVASNSSGASTPLTLTLAIAGSAGTPVVTSSRTVSGSVGVSFSYAIGTSPAATGYTATGLPGGLSLNTATATIGGSPTASGTFNVILTPSNGSGIGTPVTLVFTIAPSAILVVP